MDIEPYKIKLSQYKEYAKQETNPKFRQLVRDSEDLVEFLEKAYMKKRHISDFIMIARYYFKINNNKVRIPFADLKEDKNISLELSVKDEMTSLARIYSLEEKKL